MSHCGGKSFLGHRAGQQLRGGIECGDAYRLLCDFFGAGPEAEGRTALAEAGDDFGLFGSRLLGGVESALDKRGGGGLPEVEDGGLHGAAAILGKMVDERAEGLEVSGAPRLGKRRPIGVALGLGACREVRDRRECGDVGRDGGRSEGEESDE